MKESKKDVRSAEKPIDSEEAAFEAALKKLSYRDMTELEIRKYLEKKGFSRESVSASVQLLKEYRYIDDARFAFQYFRYGFEKRKGRERIRRELLQKGVSESSIEKGWNDYLDEYGEPDEEAMAEKEALAVLRSAGYAEDEEPDKEIPDKILARVARRLSSKGYRPAVIYQVLDHFR